MSQKSILISFVALVTFGSGVVNLLSVINASLPERHAILRNFFPLEFIHLSRSLTLLIGFALIVSAINIFKRKKRGFQFVLFLSAASVVFHMTKGLDYEEASVSLFLFVLLLFSRRLFTVKSTLPNLRWGAVRFAAGIAIVLFYGIAGFWLLDRKHFGVDFHIGDAVRETALFLAYIGNTALKPHTRYARWFLDSLYLISSVGVLYSLFALFRPVRYHIPDSSAGARKGQGDPRPARPVFPRLFQAVARQILFLFTRARTRFSPTGWDRVSPWCSEIRPVPKRKSEASSAIS